MDIIKEKLDELVNKLLALGEDEAELKLWQDIFEDLEADEKGKIIGILEKELGRLELGKKS